MPGPSQRYVVVGAGITGLAAAWELSAQVPAAQVTVLEATDQVGGKLRGARVGGVSIDVGAESVLARRPEAVDLIGEVGMGQDLVHPTGATSSIWSRGRLQPMPRHTLMGVPAEPEALLGLLTPQEVDRVRAEPAAEPGTAEDVSVGDLIASRLGDAVVDRLVEPLLGGVYAGHARSISVAAALPALLGAYQDGTPLLRAASRAVPAAPTGPGAPTPAPVFAGIRGGIHRLPEQLADALRARGVTIRTGTVVRELRPADGHPGWELVTGPVPEPTSYPAEHVLLALPPAPTGRLLGAAAPEAAELVADIETASMAVVALAFDRARLPALTGSGVLVPPVEGLAIKAATFSAAKWDWVARAGVGAGGDGQDVLVLRTSLGRHREEAALQRPDDELCHASLADLSTLLGRPVPDPLEVVVQRWGGGLPQYAVGHRARVEAILERLGQVPGVEVAGAAYDGVGVPACIGSGRAAARRLTS